MSISEPIVRPVFILGPHRSGTTLLYGIIAEHEHMCFLNRSNHRIPASPRIAALLSKIPGYAGKPVEAQRFWDYLWPGPDDTMEAEDLTPEQRRFYTSSIELLLKQRRKTRFIAKYPRLSLRVGWLAALFPDAKFLHMTRDWRAVVSSTLQRKVKREEVVAGSVCVSRAGRRCRVSLTSLQQVVSSRLLLRRLRQKRFKCPGVFTVLTILNCAKILTVSCVRLPRFVSCLLLTNLRLQYQQA